MRHIYQWQPNILSICIVPYKHVGFTLRSRISSLIGNQEPLECLLKCITPNPINFYFLILCLLYNRQTIFQRFSFSRFPQSSDMHLLFLMLTERLYSFLRHSTSFVGPNECLSYSLNIVSTLKDTTQFSTQIILSLYIFYIVQKLKQTP
jgi:hypothetical protein